jgi:hypothetical protein
MTLEEERLDTLERKVEALQLRMEAVRSCNTNALRELDTMKEQGNLTPEQKVLLAHAHFHLRCAKIFL